MLIGPLRDRRGRLVGAAVVASLVVTSLSGCSNPEPILARIQDGEIAFMVCEPATGSQVLVNVAKRDTVDYKTAWEISGQSEIRKGDVLLYGTPWLDWQETFPSVPIDAGKSAVSIVIGDDPLPEKAEFSATFAGWELSSSKWSDSQGNTFEECP